MNAKEATTLKPGDQIFYFDHGYDDTIIRKVTVVAVRKYYIYTTQRPQDARVQQLMQKLAKNPRTPIKQFDYGLFQLQEIFLSHLEKTKQQVKETIYRIDVARKRRFLRLCKHRIDNAQKQIEFWTKEKTRAKEELKVLLGRKK